MTSEPLFSTDPFTDNATILKTIQRARVYVYFHETRLFVDEFKESLFHVDSNKILKAIWCLVWVSVKKVCFRACLHEGGGPQIGEVTCGGSPHLSCKRNQIKMRNFMDRRVISPDWGSPTPCKQALRARERKRDGNRSN